MLIHIVCPAASPRAVSLLGSNFSSSPGLSTQGQGQLTNGQLGSHGLSNESSDGVPFDINDFPQLTARQSGTSGLQGSAGMVLTVTPKRSYVESERYQNSHRMESAVGPQVQGITSIYLS